MKIGISISGQIRDFNDEGHFLAPLDSSDELFEGHDIWHDQIMRDQLGPTRLDSLEVLFEGHDISFVGHTWDYCQTPNHVEKFRHFEKTSDDDISTWAIQDLARVPYKTSWNENPDWINAIKSDNGIIEIMKKNSIGAFAQTRSFDYTLRYFQQNQSDFDYFIRWRWDNRIGSDSCGRLDPTFKQHLNNWMDKTGDFKNEYPGGDVLAMTPGSSRRSMQDTCFAFNKTIVNNLTQKPYFNNLQNAIQQRKHQIVNDVASTPYSMSHTITAHELWYEYLTLYGACVTSILPNIVIHNPNPNKENKLWNL